MLRSNASERRLTAMVLEYERGRHLRDLRPARQPVQHDVAQMLGIAHGKVQQIIRFARQVKDADRLLQRDEVVDELIERRARVSREPNRHERLKRPAKVREIEFSDEATDDPALAERAYAHETCARTEADAVGKLAVRHTRVVLQKRDELTVNRIKCG